MMVSENDVALPAVWTVAMVAARWQCGSTFVYSEISNGGLKAKRYGAKLLRISLEALLAYEGNAEDAATIAAQVTAPIAEGPAAMKTADMHSTARLARNRQRK